MDTSRKVLITVVSYLLSVVCFADEEIIVISWNVESGGADPNVVASHIAAMDDVLHAHPQ